MTTYRVGVLITPEEVVLSVLISKFTFRLSDKEIEWNIGSVMYPTVGKESTKPELPLKVEIYKPETAA